MAGASAPKATNKFVVQGDYFEACSCKVMCSCIFLAPATEDHCDVFIGWHVTNGHLGSVDLKGSIQALEIDAPQMSVGDMPPDEDVAVVLGRGRQEDARTHHLAATGLEVVPLNHKLVPRLGCRCIGHRVPSIRRADGAPPLCHLA